MNIAAPTTDNTIVKTSFLSEVGNLVVVEVGKLVVVEVGGRERSVDEGTRPRISGANFSIFVSFTKD